MQASDATSNAAGAMSAMAAMMFFSLNDVLIKFLSDAYPLHEVVLVRSVIGMMAFLIFILPFTGGLKTLKTRRIEMHLLRGACVVFANTCFFMGLASMPLADAVAIFFISPLVITVFSVIFLHETVGPRRWSATFIGLAGVLIIVRPGTSAFQFVSLLPIMAAVGYALLHILTRRIGGTESAATMTFYIQLTFIFVSLSVGLSVGDGRFDDGSNASLTFLLREWHRPELGHIWILMLLGVASTGGGFLISYAYRRSEAAFVAPFEYVAMVMAIIWGYLIFDDLPDAASWVGMILIIASGLYMVFRDIQLRPNLTGNRPKLRR
ncbi:MAG: DMT family transporter [Paracoccaceae bacterium]